MSTVLAARMIAIAAPVVTGLPWSGAFVEMAEAIISHLDSQEFERNVVSALSDLRHEVRQVSTQVARQTYRQHMASGNRMLRDVQEWRTPKERRRIIDNAKTEFIRASGTAEALGSSDLLITAELAIAGCWFLLSSLPDVQRTLSAARETAEMGNVLDGKRATVNRYRQLLYLCRVFGAVPNYWAIPIDPTSMPPVGAVLAVTAPLSVAVELYGVQVHVTAVGYGAADLQLSNLHGVKVTVMLQPIDGLFIGTEGGPLAFPPQTTLSLGLRLVRQSTARLAVTARFPLSRAAPGARVGPSIAFLLPAPR
jgi:hypothetical protein